MALKLDDEVIAHIAQQLQLAIITGTDIVDNLRMIRLDMSEDENAAQTLFLSNEYREQSQHNIEKMMESIELDLEEDN